MKFCLECNFRPLELITFSASHTLVLSVPESFVSGSELNLINTGYSGALGALFSECCASGAISLGHTLVTYL